MRDPTPTRLTERPTGRSLALLHRIARAHTATPNTSSVYPRKRIPRTKCLKLALRRYTRAHPRTQCLSDGAEAGSRSIRRRGRADPVGAGRGAVNLACPVAWQSRKRLNRSATFHSKPAVFPSGGCNLALRIRKQTYKLSQTSTSDPKNLNAVLCHRAWNIILVWPTQRVPFPFDRARVSAQTRGPRRRPP